MSERVYSAEPDEESSIKPLSSEPFMSLVRSRFGLVLEALKKHKGSLVGMDALQRIVRQESDSSEATSFKDGNFYSFFGAVDKDGVPTICWYGDGPTGKFKLTKIPLYYRWRSRNRAVVE